MELYIMRHAIAALRETWEGPDGDRPLTRQGRARMRQAARGLLRLGVRFDVIVSSPLVRALQTAEVVAAELGYRSPVEICPALAPGLRPEAVFQFLASYPDSERLLLVGHEPDLGNLALTLIGGGHADRFPMRKGGVCRIDLETMPPNGPGSLVWSLTPSIMRALARR
jgi:phosphohistidine phosphatase